MNKTLWELTIFPHKELRTPEDWNNALRNGYKKYFRTAKECFESLGFRIPRQRIGYCGHDLTHEYILVRVR